MFFLCRELLVNVTDKKLNAIRKLFPLIDMVVYCVHTVYPIRITSGKAGTRGLASSAGRLPTMKKDSEAVTLVRGHSFI